MNDCSKCIAKGIKCGSGSLKNVSCKAIKEVYEQSIRKFSEWLAENVGFECTDCVRCFKCTEGTCINNLLDEYEKIQKGEQNAFVKTINLETAKNIFADRYVIDTSEHDAQVMADERKNVIEEVRQKMHEKYESIVNCYPELEELWCLNLEEIDSVFEQLKGEQA